MRNGGARWLKSNNLLAGALTLARATRGDALSDEILEAAKDFLGAAAASPAPR